MKSFSDALADRFTILRRVGEGGMGIVYEAIDRQRGQRVALKKLRWLYPLNLYRFKREFRALAEVVHPNLVSLFELHSADENWYYTMEFIDGTNFVKAHRDGSGGIAEARLRRSLLQLVDGVQALHRAGKLHRDLKPQNVLVGADDRVTILDFGLVAELQGDNPLASNPDLVSTDRSDRSSSCHTTTDQFILGTAEYMSPEQASGQTLTAASDWYAVGAMLYEVLTGRLPFEGQRLRVLMNKQDQRPTWPDDAPTIISADLRQLCLELLNPDAARRPTGKEMMQRLRGSPAGLTVATPQPATRTSIGSGELPLVGRQPQLAALQAAFEQTFIGEPATLHVVGRSGVGKTALVAKFVDELSHRQGCVVLAGRCYAEESVPFKALDSLIDSLSRFLVRLPGAEADAYLPRDIAALARVFPVLRRVDAVSEAPHRPLEIPNVQELRRRAFGALLRELLARLGDRRPLVLWVDDVQWGDTDSVAAFAELLRRPDPPRLLLILSYRSEDAAAPCLRALAEAERLVLQRHQQHEVQVPVLSPREADELAQACLSQQGLADSVEAAARVSRESRGNPYFIFELARSAGISSAKGQDEAPRLDLDEVLWQRVEELPERARLLLECVAVAGQPIRLRYALEAVHLPQEMSAVQILRAAHLTRNTGPGTADEIEMYHERIRETTIAHMPADLVRERHRRLALTLEAGGSTDFARIAVHFRGAGRADRAASFFLRAGDQARETLAFERAVDHYREVLQLEPLEGEPRRGVLVKLGDALANAGRGAEAARAYLEAAAGAPPAESRELTGRAGFQFCISGHLDDGRAAFRRVLADIGMRLPETPIATLAALLYFRARLWLRGLRFTPRNPPNLSDRMRMHLDITESVAMGSSTNLPWHGYLFQTRHLLLALASGDPVRISLAVSWEAGYASMLGGRGWHRTQWLLEISQSLAEQTQDAHALGSWSLACGIAEFLSGRYQMALEDSIRAEQIFRDQCTGVAWEQDTAQVFGLWSLFYMGRFGELRSRYGSVFHEARERGDRYLMTTLGTQVGTLLMLADDEPQAASKTLDEIMSRWTHEGFTVQHHNEFFARQLIDMYEGRVNSALDRFHVAEPRYRRALLLRIQHIRVDLMQFKARCYLAEAAREPSKREAWLSRVAGCVRRLRREHMPWSDALASFFAAVAYAHCVAQGHSGSTTTPAAATSKLITRLLSAVCQTPAETEHPTAAFAEQMLQSAAAELDASSMVWLARVADWQRGQIAGGAAGEQLAESVLNWLAEQGVRNPPRLIGTVVPVKLD
jgi:tetratricopeptide (TPR) repeat protein